MTNFSKLRRPRTKAAMLKTVVARHPTTKISFLVGESNCFKADIGSIIIPTKGVRQVAENRTCYSKRHKVLHSNTWRRAIPRCSGAEHRSSCFTHCVCLVNCSRPPFFIKSRLVLLLQSQQRRVELALEGNCSRTSKADFMCAHHGQPSKLRGKRNLQFPEASHCIPLTAHALPNCKHHN